MFAQLKPFFALPFFIFETMFLLFVTVTMLSVYIHLCYYLSLTIIYLYDKRGENAKKNTHTPRKKTEEEIFHSMSRKLVLDARITSV